MTSPVFPSPPASACPNCGGTLAFNPSLGALACLHCGHQLAIAPAATSVEEQDLDTWIGQQTTSMLSSQALEVTCPGCHAEITFEPPDVAGDCPFCGTYLSAQTHSANPVITPGGVLPFAVGQQAARHALTKWLRTRWFAPTSLKELAQHQKLQGIYLPFWTYDCHTQTTYRGERGDYYYVTKTRQVKDDKGNWTTETYQERHTRWRSASGQVSRFFDDVLIPAIASINPAHLNQLGDWPLPKLVAYTPAYLTGFRAQRYQVSLSAGFEQAKSTIAPQIRSDIQRDIGGDEQRIHTHSTSYSRKQFKHILLPVWLATYRYKNQPYQVMIHGYSGKVVGDRPYSPAKITLAVLGGLLLAGGIWAAVAWYNGDLSFGQPRLPQPELPQTAPPPP